MDTTVDIMYVTLPILVYNNKKQNVMYEVWFICKNKKSKISTA